MFLLECAYTKHRYKMHRTSDTWEACQAGKQHGDGHVKPQQVLILCEAYQIPAFSRNHRVQRLAPIQQLECGELNMLVQDVCAASLESTPC